MKISARGQITLPQPIRNALGWLPDAEVEFEIVDDWLRVTKVEHPHGRRGQRLVEHMRGRGTVGMSTDEILRLTRG